MNEKELPDEIENVNIIGDDFEFVNEFEDEQNDDDDVDEAVYPTKTFSEYLVKFDNEVERKKLVAFLRTYNFEFIPSIENEFKQI